MSRQKLLKIYWPEALLILAFIYQFVLTVFFSVEVPFWDEWEFFFPGVFDGWPSLSWLFSRHNEHIILFTKLQTIFWFHLTGLHIRSLIAVNFMIYSGVVFLFLYLKNRVLGREFFPEFALCLIPLFSSIPFMNHLFMFQSQFHFVMLGTLALVWVLESTHWNFIFRLFSGLFLVFFTIFSMSHGLIMVASILIVYGSSEIFQTQRIGKLSSFFRSLEARLWIVQLCGLILFSFFWFNGRSLKPIFPYASPLSEGFWIFFLSGLGKAFGQGSHGRGIFVSLLVFVVSIWGVSRFFMSSGDRLSDSRSKGLFREDELRNYRFFVALALGILMSLAAMAVARASVDPHSGNESRYFGLLGFLFPAWVVMVFGLFWDLQIFKKNYPRIVTFILLILFAGKFGWSEHLRMQKRVYQALACLKNADRQSLGQIDCPLVYPGEIKARVDYAKSRNVVFTREFR